MPRGQETGQRELTRSEHHIVLGFLHIALYLENLLSGKHNEKWLEHLLSDIRGLSNSMSNISTDDTCLHFHYFLKQSISFEKKLSKVTQQDMGNVHSFNLTTCWQTTKGRREWESFIKNHFLAEVLSDEGKEKHISPLRQCVLQGTQMNSKNKLQTLLLYLIQENNGVDILNPGSIVDTNSLFLGGNALWNVRTVNFSIQQVSTSYNTYKTVSERNAMLENKPDSILDVLFRNQELNLFSIQKLGSLPRLLQFRNDIMTFFYKKEAIEDALLQVVTNAFTESGGPMQIEEDSPSSYINNLSPANFISTKNNSQPETLDLIKQVQTIAHTYNVWPFRKTKFDRFQCYNILRTVLDRVIDYLIRDHNILITAAFQSVTKKGKKGSNNEIELNHLNNLVHENDLAIVDMVLDVLPLSLSVATYSRNSKSGRTLLQFDFAALERLLISKYDLATKPHILNRWKPKSSNNVKESEYKLINENQLSTNKFKNPICLNTDLHAIFKSASNDISRVSEYIMALETLIRFACRHNKYKHAMKSAIEEHCAVKMLGKLNRNFFEQQNTETLQSYHEQFDHKTFDQNSKRTTNNMSTLGSLFQDLKDKSKHVFLEDALDLKLLLELKRTLLLGASGVKLFSDKFNTRICNKALHHPSTTKENLCKYACLARYLLEILKFWETAEFDYVGMDDEVNDKNSLANPNSEWSLKYYLDYFHNGIVSESIINELVSEEITVGESSSYFLKVAKFCFPCL